MYYNLTPRVVYVYYNLTPVGVIPYYKSIPSNIQHENVKYTSLFFVYLGLRIST